MRVVLMNQFYPPARAPTGRLLHDLAETLRGRGHQVDVICSERPYGRATGVFAKSLEYTGFYFNASRALSQMRPAPDVVVCMTTPPFLGLIAARQKKKGAAFVLWCMDLYPEALVAGGLLKEQSLTYRLLKRITRAERLNADAIITLGPDMTRRVRVAAPAAPVIEIPVWSELSLDSEMQGAAKALRHARGWADDDLVLMYSGNMGRAHRIEEFLALAPHLSNRIVRIVFCGNGPKKHRWKKDAGTVFQWVESVGKDELAAHLLSADIHLISQQAEWAGVVVPSKYQAACSLGRPVIFAGPPESAVACWIRQGDTGWVLPPDDPDALGRVAREIQSPEEVDRRTKQASLQSRCLFDDEKNRAVLADCIERAGAKNRRQG
jgi:glycosyltransferase involved in cell wall biosynthesis